MKLGKAAQMLGVNDKTLRNWIDRPELKPHFSADATTSGAGVHREISDNDLFVLNTIRVLRVGMPNNDPDWQRIAGELSAGHIDRQLPPQAAALDTGLSMISQVGVVKERDLALARVSELEQREHDLQARLDEIQGAWRSDTERLLRELSAAREEMAEIRVELKLYRAGKIKPGE